MSSNESPEPEETTGQDLSKQFIAGINKFKSQMKKTKTRNELPNNNIIVEKEPSNVSVGKSIDQCNSLITRGINIAESSSSPSTKDTNIAECGSPSTTDITIAETSSSNTTDINIAESSSLSDGNSRLKRKNEEDHQIKRKDKEDHRPKRMNDGEDHQPKLNHAHPNRPLINPVHNHQRQFRKKWTGEELQALEDGMREYGTQWVKILEKYGPNGPLRNRTQVQLKDKARNEKQRRTKVGMDAGIFAQASG